MLKQDFEEYEIDAIIFHQQNLSLCHELGVMRGINLFLINLFKLILPIFMLMKLCNFIGLLLIAYKFFKVDFFYILKDQILFMFDFKNKYIKL